MRALHMIRVRSSPVTCGQRINNRDASRQVTCSQEMIEKSHQITESLDWSWDLELVNDGEGISTAALSELLNGYCKANF